MPKKLFIALAICFLAIRGDCINPKPSFAVIDWSHPLSQGLILMEPLCMQSADLTSGDAAKDGVIHGTSYSWVGSSYGQVFKYTSTDANTYIGFNQTRLNLQKDNRFTIELLIYFTDGSAATGRQIPCCNLTGTGQANTNGIFIDFNSNGDNFIRFVLRTDSNGGTIAIDAETTLAATTTNSWNDVVITYDGSSTAAGVNLYVNGVKKSMTATTDNLTGTYTPGEWQLGRGGGTFNAAGSTAGTLFAKNAVWNRTLSAAEVAQLAHDPFAHLRIR